MTFILDTCRNSHVREFPDTALLVCFIASYPSNKMNIKCGPLGSGEMGCQVEPETTMSGRYTYGDYLLFMYLSKYHWCHILWCAED